MKRALALAALLGLLSCATPPKPLDHAAVVAALGYEPSPNGARVEFGHSEQDYASAAPCLPLQPLPAPLLFTNAGRTASLADQPVDHRPIVLSDRNGPNRFLLASWSPPSVQREVLAVPVALQQAESTTAIWADAQLHNDRDGGMHAQMWGSVLATDGGLGVPPVASVICQGPAVFATVTTCFQGWKDANGIP